MLESIENTARVKQTKMILQNAFQLQPSALELSIWKFITPKTLSKGAGSHSLKKYKDIYLTFTEAETLLKSSFDRFESVLVFFIQLHKLKGNVISQQSLNNFPDGQL